ncbi:GGDEF domain-containing protein [Achromobacter xylosoxidans]
MTTSLFFLVWGLATALALPLLLPFNARRVPGVRAFTIANALAVLSLLAYASAEILPPAVYVMVSNTSWLVAVSLVYVGVRQFFGLRPQVLRVGAAAAVGIAAMALMLYVAHDLVGRMMLFSGYTGVLMAATGAVVFRQRRGIRTPGVILYVLLSLSALVVLHALRAGVYGSGWAQAASLLEPAPWGLFFIVCGSVTVPALFLALLLLIQTSLSEQMQAALTFDSLTGAYSRRSILDELEHELQRCARSGGRLAVLVLDIDHFKSINDRHGHAAGDAALRHFAQVVPKAVRASDRFGRLGGEEFVLLMYGCDAAHAGAGAAGLRRPARFAAVPAGAGIAHDHQRRRGHAAAGRFGRWHPGSRRPGALQGQGAGARPGRNGLERACVGRPQAAREEEAAAEAAEPAKLTA